MKKILFALFVMASFASCKKCMKCSNGEKFCEGQYKYETVKNYGTLTDDNGQQIATCKESI